MIITTMTDSNSHSEETQEISLRLEHYDDMFSDFDIRPYSKRALSVDFLDEIKRAIRDGRYEQVELVLHIPAKEVSESHQATIRDRLSGHFKRHFDLLLKEKRKVRRLGVSMVILGIVSMVAATVIVFEDPRESLLLSFLVIFLEPAAWFLLWEGMDQIIFNSKSINPELDFYRKMSNSHGHVHFSTY